MPESESPGRRAIARAVALYAACARSGLTLLLLVLTLGMPLAQIAHQASHHHQALGASDRLAPVGQQSRADDIDDDEAGCALCQLLNARADAATTTDDLSAIVAAPLVAVCVHVSPRGITPASLTIAFARGPPRVS